MIKKAKCKLCGYSVETGTQFRECRRKSPSHTEELCGGQHARWPLVDPEKDWCGDFEGSSDAGFEQVVYGGKYTPPALPIEDGPDWKE